MKILTICSSPYVPLKPVTQLLESAGLPKGGNSVEKNQSYEQWHEQVFNAYEQDCSGLFMSQSLKPGKVWQNLAIQLVQANLGKTQWYWADSKAGWLLEFWADLEPQHRFALIYSPPQFGISQCLLQTDEQAASIELIVKSWVNYHFELLRFYRRHKEKCILVNMQRCVAYPSEFIQLCRQYLELDIDEQPVLQNAPQPLTQLSGIEEVLFHLIVKQYPEINNLFQEIEASATPFTTQVDTQSVTQVSGKQQLANFCSDYRSLKAWQAEGAKINAQLLQEQESQLLRIQKLESDKKQEIVSLQASIKKSEYAKVVLEIQKTQEIAALQASIKNVEEAKATLERKKSQEIATLQASTKKVKEAKQAIEKQKEHENQALQVILKNSEGAKKSLEKKIHTLQDEVKQCEQKSIEYGQENKLILLQLHQTQEELEAQFLMAQKLDSDKAQEIGVLQVQLKQVEETKTVLEKQQTQKIHEIQTELKQCKQKSIEYGQENKQILLQLQQTQKELEAQFSKAQKLDSNNAQKIGALQVQLKQAEESKSALAKQQVKETQALHARLKQAEESKSVLAKKQAQETQAIQTEVKQSKQKNVEYEQENELMLLQLHQVQEELEHYFVKYQTLESNTQSRGTIAFIEQQQDATSLISAQLIQVKQEAEGLGVDLINLQWQEQIWPKYHLQIIKPCIIFDQIVTPAAIKLPLQANNLLPLITWPPQTADEQGAYWMIDESLLSIERMHSHFCPEDIAFLHALACQLPEWLKILEKNRLIKNDQWEDYYQVIDILKPGLEVVSERQ